jgi:hypothetical protein
MLVLHLLLGARTAVADDLPVHTSSGIVTIRAEAGLEEVAARLAGAARGRLDRIESDLVDLPHLQAIEVRVVRTPGAMQEVAPAGRRVPQWAAGVAFPDLGILIVSLQGSSPHHNFDEVFAHELAHLALGAAIGDRPPRWLHEGFAHQHSAEWSFERAETLAGMAWSSSTIPLDELDRVFPEQELPAGRAYAQSYDLVRFLSERGRWQDLDDDGDRWPFRRFLGALGAGRSLDDAAVLAYGRPMAELFHEWRQQLAQRYVFVPAGAIAFVVWLVAAILLVLAWRKRRRDNRARLLRWELEEAAAHARAIEEAERVRAAAGQGALSQRACTNT